MSKTPDLDIIDLATAKEDKICIERDHETANLSWRFATPQADPIAMMMRVSWLQIVRESGYHERIERIRRAEVAEEGDLRVGGRRRPRELRQQRGE